MSNSFLFVPRMSLNICNNIITQDVLNSYTEIDFYYFNPLNPEEKNNSWQADPKFPMDYQNARIFVEEISKTIKDTKSNLESDKILVTEINNLKFNQLQKSKISNQISEDELNDIAAFTANQTFKHSHSLAKPEKKEYLIAIQKMLLLANLLEEQDLDLYCLEKNIFEQNKKIQSYINNPLEKALVTENVSKDILEQAENASFSELKTNSKKDYKEQFKNHALATDDLAKINFQANWQKIFLSQLFFMENCPYFIVNDYEMANDLYEFKTNSKCVFVQNITENPLPNETQNINIDEFQRLCIKNKFELSLLTISTEVLYNQEIANKIGNKKLNFLIPNKLLAKRNRGNYGLRK